MKRAMILIAIFLLPGLFGQKPYNPNPDTPHESLDVKIERLNSKIAELNSILSEK